RNEIDAMLFRLDGPVPQHEMREVEGPFVRRHVRALGHEAHVAERAGLFDLAVVRLRHPVEFAGRAIVYQVEQPRKGIAEIEAATAAVTDLEHTLHLLLERLFVPKPGILPIEGEAHGRFETAFTHATTRGKIARMFG